MERHKEKQKKRKEKRRRRRDPRDELEKPILKSDILEMKNLKEGMLLEGTVRNGKTWANMGVTEAKSDRKSTRLNSSH